MRQVVLEGRELSSQAALHDALAELFGFPPFYGRNWDALWDVLEDSDLNNVQAPPDPAPPASSDRRNEILKLPSKI